MKQSKYNNGNIQNCVRIPIGNARVKELNKYKARESLNKVDKGTEEFLALATQ